MDGANPGSDDESAVDRVLAGDVEAFAAIVARWQGPLVNLAWRFCRDHDRAEDMAQEAFLRAFRKLASWRRDAAFSSWLFTVATNLYRTEIRRVPPTAMPFDDELAGEDSVEAQADLAQQGRLVQLAVQSLPPKYREPLVLFYFHEQDVAMTAASLSLPEGTVKARLSRARKLLRSKLENRV